MSRRQFDDRMRGYGVPDGDGRAGIADGPDMPRRGAALVTALLAMLVLGAIGTMISVTVTEDMLISSNQAESTQCLYVSEAGLNYSLAKIRQTPSWGGLVWPGRRVGEGRFVVAVSDSSASGNPLPPGEKRINVRAIEGGTEREIEVLVQ